MRARVVDANITGEAGDVSFVGQAKADIEAEKRTGNAPLTLRFAAGRYWAEAGEHHADKSATWTNLNRLVDYFGKDKRLDQITDADVDQRFFIAVTFSWAALKGVGTSEFGAG